MFKHSYQIQNKLFKILKNTEKEMDKSVSMSKIAISRLNSMYLLKEYLIYCEINLEYF